MRKTSLILAMIVGYVMISCNPIVDLPSAVTKSIDDVTENTAKVIVQVSADGGSDVMERGVCWNTEGNPTIIDFRTFDGQGVGTFTSTLEDLKPNTTYYVKAYATNEKGTGYGDELIFTTVNIYPEVETVEIINVATSSALVESIITSDNGYHVVERGVCWSTSETPTIDDFVKSEGSGTGYYSIKLTGLDDNTTYHVRAYATNENGTGYGDELTFTTIKVNYDPDGEIAGHEFVDLGLPSGKKWATCNVGADTPEDYGDYFAWGETSPKAEYTNENSITYGQQMSDFSGNSQYDAATANWGGSWRMPTKGEMQELVDHCEWERTEVNGVNGSRVIGPNGSCIFLPAAGFRYVSAEGHGFFCVYWSSTPGYSDSYHAYALGYIENNVDDNFYRDFGLTVRPITE